MCMNIDHRSLGDVIDIAQELGVIRIKYASLLHAHAAHNKKKCIRELSKWVKKLIVELNTV